jgi:hypothetical protein
MQTIYEPIVPIDSFNIDKVSIKNSVFVYDDQVYTSFTTKIMLDNVPLHFSQKQNISIVKIHSPQLMQIQMELEKKIKESRINQFVDREKYCPYISVNFTDKSRVDLIPTKVSNKSRIHIKTKDEFYSQLISYYKNKFDGINAKANIVLQIMYVGGLWCFGKQEKQYFSTNKKSSGKRNIFLNKNIFGYLLFLCF